MTEQKYFPNIQAARLIKRYDTGTHEVVLLTDIKSDSIVQYSHMLVATLKNEEDACYVIAAEVNICASPGDGSHFLGSFPGIGHINHGCSDDWADLSCFERDAQQLMSNKLNIKFKHNKPLPSDH